MLLNTDFYKDHIPDVLDSIKKLTVSKFIIAIDGPGGSGKSTFAKELSEHIPNSFIIHMDDFYFLYKKRSGEAPL